MYEPLPTTWAITEAALSAIVSRARLGDVGPRVVAARFFGTDASGAKGVGVVPIHGVIGRFPSWWNGTSTAEIGADLDQALRSRSVKRIVLHCDSPGGAVGGIPELAAKIHEANRIKPVEAVSDTQMASAAYWLGSAAGRISVTPSGEAGSIGVYLLHVDQSKWNEKSGFSPTYISAGKYKIEGNPHSPLSPEATAAFQASVDDTYRHFIRDVAKFRGATPSSVRFGFGEGRVLPARQAVSEGLADRVATPEDVIAGEDGAGPSRRNSNRQASAISDEDRRRRWRNDKRKIESVIAARRR